MSSRYSATERAQIAAGTFFTAGELAARPGLGGTVRQSQQAPAGQPGDPNSRPVSAAARALAESPGVCAYCYEPGDERSALADLGHGPMHAECDEAWQAAR
jgi:hypothetical protein